MRLDKVDPDRVPGRVTFITRMGAHAVREALPPIVERVTEAGASVTWICDPMHGNTFASTTGFKTRNFDDVVDEVREIVPVHRAELQRPAVEHDPGRYTVASGAAGQQPGERYVAVFEHAHEQLRRALDDRPVSPPVPQHLRPS